MLMPHTVQIKSQENHTQDMLFLSINHQFFGTVNDKTSAFSSKFIALCVCIEAVRGLRYKLHMFGVPLLDNEPTYIFCDNNAVVKNCSHVESVLNKKHNSLAYHYARWSIAAGETMLGWINTHYNIADAFTKRLSALKCDDLFWRWTY